MEAEGRRTKVMEFLQAHASRKPDASIFAFSPQYSPTKTWYHHIVLWKKPSYSRAHQLGHFLWRSAQYRKTAVQETLILEKLGPIGRLEIKPRPLTIIIGEQASGKSLVAQMLYFFRGLESHLARIFSPDLVEQTNWPDVAVRRILDGLRGVPFGYFANGTAKLQYRDPVRHGMASEWGLSVRNANRTVRVQKGLREEMEGWAKRWKDEPDLLGFSRDPSPIFIPTERSAFARLSDLEPSVLFADYQPEPFRRFASLLYAAQRFFSPEDYSLEDPQLPSDWVERQKVKRTWMDFIRTCQLNALAGEAYVPRGGPLRWKWRLDKSSGNKILPIAATASGQMEAWPFFVIASRYGTEEIPCHFFFEEPETHLHPTAQVEVMKVIALLVNIGHSFVVTTHSPYILYVINNMIQRFISLRGMIPEGEHRWLNPDTVAAYRLKQRADEGLQDVMDRGDTDLIDEQELDRVANELGGEFDDLLYGME
jgi:hypothetical protein